MFWDSFPTIKNLKGSLMWGTGRKEGGRREKHLDIQLEIAVFGNENLKFILSICSAKLGFTMPLGKSGHSPCSLLFIFFSKTPLWSCAGHCSRVLHHSSHTQQDNKQLWQMTAMRWKSAIHSFKISMVQFLKLFVKCHILF